jgi:chromosome segregation ATPase
MTKKLALETKIRDAALSLSRVNSAHKNVSKQSEEHLESANRRVDTAQKELWRLSERGNDVNKRLLEHRAAVLSASVRNMEQKMSLSSNSEDSGYDSSNRSTLMSPATAVSTLSGASLSSSSKQAKFDGPHLFAGHENALVPRRKFSPETASKEITTLEEKLKAATSSLAESSKIQAELKKELSHIRLEKQEVETMLGLELQTAEDTIKALEQELPRLEGLDREVKSLRQEKTEWEEERGLLEEQAQEIPVLRARVQDLELGTVEKSGDAEKLLSGLRAELSSNAQELQQLKDTLERERADWELERNTFEDEKMDDLARLQEEMDRQREQDEQVLQQANTELNGTLSSLRSLLQRFNIPLGDRTSQTSSMQHLLNAVTKHLDSVYDRMEQLQDGGDRTRQLEAELQSALGQQQALAKELAETKKERDAAKRETFTSSSVRSMSMASSSSDSRRSKAESIKSPPMPFANLSGVTPETSEFGPDVEGAKFIAALQPLWNILPSPEARASKFTSSNSRAYRSTPSPAGNGSVPVTPAVPPPVAQQPSSSLSDLDVRSLKALYDSRRPTGVPGSPMSGASIQFTLEGFIGRVHALIQDDRALIERLIRFAQAHDLLKKNAERAQKLAQDGNLALETYQKQVKLLEERNSNMVIKNGALCVLFSFLLPLLFFLLKMMMDRTGKTS